MVRQLAHDAVQHRHQRLRTHCHRAQDVWIGGGEQVGVPRRWLLPLGKQYVWCKNYVHEINYARKETVRGPAA